MAENGVYQASDTKVFGEYSMKIVAVSSPQFTDLAKANFIDLSGLDNACVSAYIRMFDRTSGQFVCRVQAYDDTQTLLGSVDWTILTQSGETEFTRYHQSFNMALLGEVGQLPVGTRFIKMQFGWDGVTATGTTYVDGVKAESGTTPTAWTPYSLKEQDSLDLVSDGTVYKRVKDVSAANEITTGSIEDSAIIQAKISDQAVSGSKLKDAGIDLTTKVFNELPNANLAQIQDAGKIQDDLLPEGKLDADAQGKLAALQTDGKVKGPLVKSDDSSTLIDTATGKMTSNLKTTTDIEVDQAINNADSLHSRAIAEPHEDANVAVASIHDAGGGVYTYRLGHQAAGAAINIGELGDSLDGLFDLRDTAGGDLLDGSSDPITVTGICYSQDGTNPITPGDTQEFSGLGAGWWFNDDGGVANSTVYIKLSALPAGGVTNFDALYSARNTVGNLGRNALVKKAVIQGEADPNITATIKDLKGTDDWNTSVEDGRQLIDLTDTQGKIATGKVVENSLDDGSVTTDKLGTDAVTNSKIGNFAVDTNELAALAVTTNKIASGAVTTEKLPDEAVTTVKLGHEAVTSTKIADNAVTQLKLGTNAAGADELKNEQGSLAKITNNMLQRDDADGSVKIGSGVAVKHVSDGSVVITTTGLIGTGKVSNGAIQDSAVTGAKIGANEVATGHIADDAVTQAKIGVAAVGSDELAGSSVIAGKIADNAVGSTEIAGSAVTEAKISDGAVSSVKIGALAVTSDKVAGGAVGTTKLADDAVTQAKIGPSAVGSTELDDQAVSTAKIALGAVATDRLANLAVSTDKLADDAVDANKLADVAVETNHIKTGAVNADKLATGAVTKEKVAADVFSELATTNLVIGGSFETAVW